MWPSPPRKFKQWRAIAHKVHEFEIHSIIGTLLKFVRLFLSKITLLGSTCNLKCRLKKLESIQKSGCSHRTATDTDEEGVDPSEVQTKPKRTFNQLRSWNFRYTIQTDLLGEQGVSIDAKKILLSKHLRTRLVIKGLQLSCPLLYSVI